MKKLYISLSLIAATGMAFGQTSPVRTTANLPTLSNAAITQTTTSARAAGDTLFFADFPAYVINPTDAATFMMDFEDIDQKAPAAPYANAGITSEWMLFEDSPGDNTPDTNKFLGATSWFAQPGMANNWIYFGPLTIPANGATLKWEAAFNPQWRDSYEVKLSTSGMTAADFTTPAIFNVTDLNNATSTGIDTALTQKSVAIPATYNGQQIYVGFHHKANDMDFLYLDKFLVVENLGVSVKETKATNLTVSQNQPNPFTIATTIAFELVKASSNNTLNIYDITGKVVYTENIGERAAGKHNIQLNSLNMNSGIYFYNFTIDGTTTASKKMIKQ